MKLYNVTFQPEYRNTLIPKVPLCSMPKEDDVTPRVCLTDSISNCLQALPTEHRDIRKGAILEVREAVIQNKQKLLCPVDLYASGRVPDALENNEYWYLGKVKVRSYTVAIISFSYEYTIAWTMITPEDINCILMELTGKTLPGITAKNIYDLAHKTLSEDVFEVLTDEIANIPYASKIAIHDVVTEPVTI